MRSQAIVSAAVSQNAKARLLRLRDVRNKSPRANGGDQNYCEHEMRRLAGATKKHFSNRYASRCLEVLDRIVRKYNRDDPVAPPRTYP